VFRLRLHQHLYLRIWLAMVAAIVVITLLLGWMWRMHWAHERAQRPDREVVVRSAQGEVIGQAPARLVRVPGQPPEYRVTLDDGQTLSLQLPRLPRPPGMRNDRAPTEPFQYLQSAWGFVSLLLGVALVVALAAYPFVRRLTQRLEALQRGVERWGEGDLAVRLPVQGRDEVAFLAQRFNTAADRVQAVLASHKTLLANASHELRSPLARIRMGLELLARAGAGDTANVEQQRLEIARSIGELDALIDEILLASRLDAKGVGEAGPWEATEEVDLLGLAAEEAARTGATLEVDEGIAPVLLQGQAKWLRRLLRNLLENARRHGLRGGDPASIVLTLSRVGQGSSPAGGAVQTGWQVTVSDHGPGVPEAYRERIFEPFFRLPGASERDGGVGLGLALVKTIAQRHGGQVRCESHPGGGAQFVVFLPTI
jgi:two-component system, OmpR family, sensor kinase